MSRFQNGLPAGIIALVGIYATYASYTQQPAEAFAFPRLVSAVFVVLALWTLTRAFLDEADKDTGVNRQAFLKMLPGLIVSCVYVFWAAKMFGFYTATSVAFFVLLSLYDPAPHTVLMSWVKRVIITAGFVAVMYGLFALLLKVYTPREIFF